jgi:SprT protein
MAKIHQSVARGVTEDVVRDWVLAWSSLWGTPDLPATIHITFSPRLRASLGRCSPRTGSIRLNPGLLDADPAILREVLCHEAAHVAAWLLHGRRARPHGREWKDLMRAAGYEPRVRWPHQALPGALRAARRPAVLYLHTCPVCHARRTARRPVRAWRCRRCVEDGLDGRLEITSRPVTREASR